MVAIVTGTGLGLDRSSGFVLGSAGQLGSAVFGSAGEGVTVNAATGNLVVTRSDEILIGQGLDGVISRSYNSLGVNSGDNGHNWQIGTSRHVTGLTGTVNTAGSTVTLIDWDGSDVLYSYNSSLGAYVCTQGGGADHRLTFASNVWTWSDGRNGVTETYDALNNGRLTSSTDADGNHLTYTYTGSLLTRVTTADGEHTDLTWSGTNLMQVTTTLSGGATLNRVRYTYDASNRLSTVTTDLTPSDNSIADGNDVVTTYTYDGTSNRIATISQTGGAQVAFTYDGSGRVLTVTQTVVGGGTPVTRTTTFAYGTNSTTVTDPNGQVTTLNYDAKGQLTQVQLPPAQVGAAAQTISYTYNSDGDVLTATDASGNVTTYTYDSNDNLLTVQDALGNTVTRTYDAGNHVLTETRTPGAGQSGTQETARFAYGSTGHLRYVISGDGRVTEYRYNSAGQQIASVAYRDNAYDLTGLSSATALSESTLNTWVAALSDLSTTLRTDTTYDFRGNVATVTSYSVLTTGTQGAGGGVGVTTSPYTVVTYVYDQFGNLLSRQTSGIANTEVFTYDGLGRRISSTDLNGATTSIAFNDAGSTTVVTLANGLVQTSTYDLAGELISYSESGTGYATTTANYKYDSLGNLRMATDATGRTSYFLFDNVGRKIADIAADGSIVEYRYDASNRLVATIGYATKLTSAQLSSLVDANGNPANVALSSVRPGSSSSDVWSWRIYDQDNRLIETIDGDGDATAFAYDGLGNLVTMTSYANVIAAATVTGFKTTLPTTLQLPTANPTADNVTKSFYDNDGHLIGLLDGDGYLAQVIYNQAGQKIETVAYLNKPTVTTGTFAQVLASVTTSARDEHSRFFYDDRGLLRYTLDANLRPTELVYDNAGNAIETIEYGGSINSTSSYTLAYVQSQITSTGLNTNPNNRTSFAVYDAAGRVAYTIDAAGEVVKFGYDALGRVIKQTRFVTLDPVSSAPSQATMDSWAVANASASDRVSRMVYDLASHLVYTVDGEGYVTEYRYDAAGRTTLTIRYAAQYTVTDSVTQASLAAQLPGTIPSTAVQTSFSYDSDGRLSDTFDGLGIDTHLVYDALGRITDRTLAYGTSDAATTHLVYDTADRVLSETRAYGQSEAATVSFIYDGFGHVLTRTDARGFATTYTYDALGRVLTATVPLDASNNAVTTYTYDAFGNVLTTTDPRGNVSYFFYDSLNRQTLSIDTQGYATATAYTIGNEIAGVTRYVTAVTGTITPGVPPTITTNAADATTSFTRDLLGRVTRVTDAEGYYEQYTLNAFGDRVSVRNKLGGVTTNTFDHRGLILSEVLPESSIRADGTTEATSVTNTFSYDARGNRLTMVEASGLTEQRTTTYTYDLNDRLLTTAGDAVQVVASDLQTVSTVTPTTTIKYDNRGNVIETDDAAGARTLTYYDHLGRRSALVNALGTLSTWTYDANGNAVSCQVYGDAVTLPTNPGGTPPSPVNPSNYRQTSYSYDRNNRLLTTTVASLRTGEYGSSYATTVGNISTTNAYDKDGNVIQQTDGRGNSIYTYFDKLGRKIAQVDQANYVTTWTLDANGNVTSETRFATAYVGTPSTSTPPTVSSNANDRVTNFTYDRNGRRLTEQRTGVAAWSVNATTGALTAASTTATITYAYNGLGEVTSKTEATGDQTTYVYDSAGRQTQVLSPTFTDWNGNTVQPATNEYYDGLNNLTRTSQGDALHSGTTPHVTTYSYGAEGRLASMTDAAGFTKNYGYDIAGRTVKVSYTRLKSDGVTSLTEAQATQYDALGRQILQSVATQNGTTWTFGDQVQTQYDVYGEVSARGVNGLFPQTYSYDSGGRVWRSNADDGTVKLYLYDAAGNNSLVISSDGNALPTGYDWSTITLDQAVNLLTNNGASAIGTINVAGMVLTFTKNDQRGQATSTIMPFAQLSVSGGVYTTATITHGKSYNAFGEVAGETDARGNVTTYAYNTMGRVIQRTLPAVSWTSENGAQATATPIQYSYYDLSGRVVATKDANNNLNTRMLRAGSGYGGTDPDTIKEFHADTGVFTNAYDVFGDRRQTINEIGKTETYNFDAMDRLTSQVHQQRSDGTQLTDNYVYDGLGRRVKHWNSQLGSSVFETTDYDSQGRVSNEVDMMGNATNYTYAWSSTAATTGLGTFGGWTKTTTAPGGRSEAVTSDYFGRTVAKTRYDANADLYTFDLAGRLTNLQTVQWWHAYSYFNTGNMASASWKDSNYQTGGTDTYTATYAYDAQGNRTFEGETDYSSYYGNTTNYENATVTWDALNRMTSLNDTQTGGGGAQFGGVGRPPASGDPISISWEYDLNSNIRRRLATYHAMNGDGSVASATSTQDDWYKYDSMNRFVTTKGEFVGARGTGYIDRGPNGTDITYDLAGNRATAAKTLITHSINYTYQEQKELYTYSADGYLMQDNVALGSTVSGGSTYIQPPAATGSGTKRAQYVRDAMGRVTSYSEYNSAGTSVVYSKTATYNADSQATDDQVTTVRTDGTTWVSNDHYDYRDETVWGNGNFTGSYENGQITHIRTTTTKNGTSQPTTDTKYGYAWWDAPEENEIIYTPNVNQSTQYTTYDYRDGDGVLMFADIEDGTPRNVYFVTDPSGNVMRRDVDHPNSTMTAPHEIHYLFNGIQVGDVSNNGTSDVDYVTSIADHQKVPGSGYFMFGASSATPSADFDSSYDPINGLTYSSASTSYTVQDGDTLQSVAQQIWGDSSLWYLIADVNGLSSDSTLTAGTTLIIPDKVANFHNSSSTYRVYDPNQIIGDLTPTHPPITKHGCGFFGQIIKMVLVAILGDVPGQLISMGVGIQKSFNWDELAITAATAVVNALVPGFAFVENAMLNTVLNGALDDALVQGFSVATGLQKSFDWAGVAAAGISAGAIQELKTSPLFGSEGFFADLGNADLNASVNHFANSMAGDIVNASARSLINGTDFGNNLILGLPDVMGQTVGNAIAGGIEGDDLTSSQANNTTNGMQYAARDLMAGDTAIDIGSAPSQPAPQQPPQSEGFFGWLGDEISSGWHALVQGGENLVNDVTETVGLGQVFDTTDPTIEKVVVTANRLPQSQTPSRAFLYSPELFAVAGTSAAAAEDGAVFAGAGLPNLAVAIGYVGISRANGLYSHYANGTGATPILGIPFDPPTAFVGQQGFAVTTLTKEESTLAANMLLEGNSANEISDALSRLRAKSGEPPLPGADGPTSPQTTLYIDNLDLTAPVYDADPIHGNSLLSPRTAYLYRLVSDEGAFLKYGVSQDPETRYSADFMADKDIVQIESGSRVDMLDLERSLVTQNPGPLNFEPWAVRARAGQGQ